MLFYDRSTVPPPAELRSDEARAERVALLELMSGDRDRISQAVPKRLVNFGEETKRDLARLFRSKCAFCETKGAGDVHHFRPPAEAEPLDPSEVSHLYYAWLRTDWNNLYPICRACNRASGRRFPTRTRDRGRLPMINELEAFANENYGVWRWKHNDKPWLLDPCSTRNYVHHLGFATSGEIFALRRAGRETIDTFDLARSSLTSSRRDAFEQYVSMLTSDRAFGSGTVLFDFPSLEFGGGWYLLLRAAAARAGGEITAGLRLDRAGMRKACERILGSPRTRTVFLDVLNDFSPLASAVVPPPAPKATNAPRLSSFGVSSFKALERLEVTVPSPVPGSQDGDPPAEASAVMILGENAAGKSSILEALALGLSPAHVVREIPRPPGDFVLDPSMMGSSGGGRATSAAIELVFDDGSRREVKIADRYEVVEAGGALPPVFAYGAFRQYAGAPRSPSRLGSIGTLFDSSVILPNPERWLLGMSAPEFAMVARALQPLLSIEGEFDVLVKDEADTRCLVVTRVGFGEEAEEIRTPLSVVSSGFRSILAMVCDIFEALLRDDRVRDGGFASAQVVVLIDEIEAHLHPRWKMQIMGAFRRVLPRALIIATTHDPLCLRGMHQGEVLLLNRNRRERAGKDEVPVVVEAVSMLPNVETLTIEQLLTSEFFSMFSTDSPEAESRLAKLADLLARRSAGEALAAADQFALGLLESEVQHALPLGSSEVQRLVVKAVATYLEKRRGTLAGERRRLEDETVRLIVDALEGY